MDHLHVLDFQMRSLASNRQKGTKVLSLLFLPVHPAMRSKETILKRRYFMTYTITYKINGTHISLGFKSAKSGTLLEIVKSSEGQINVAA